LLAAVLLAAPVRAFGQTVAAGEYEVKAAYLVNFLLFVKPTAVESQTGRSERVIGIVGADPFGASFKEVEGCAIGEDGRKLRIVRFPTYERTHVPALRRLDLLFVAASERRQLPPILAALSGAPVVTVSELDGFIEAGGMFRLLLVGSHVRWEMNRAAIGAGGLTPSAQLCRTALRVTNGAPP
jgi:hypothetical protein